MKKVLFLANHFITLYSFRKELIRKLVEDGHDVYLSLPESDENAYFKNLGCKIILTQIDRRGVNPISDLKLIASYRKIISQVDPDIIFSYTIKPNIYGTLVSNRTGHRQVCNVTGTGATFLKDNLISRICKELYRLSIRKCYKVFFQNAGDRDFFIENKMVADNYDMLPGSGCNLQEHAYKPMEDDGEVRFIFIGRVMKLKGIDEYLQCAQVIRQKYPNTKFYIAGWNEEPEYKQIVAEAEARGDIEYIGFRKDISNWMEKCHCTILPSHGGEGVPNVLLETAATGRACIASKINGSMDVVDDGVTGYLFETGDAASLTEQVEKFLKLTFEERKAMGGAGRSMVEKNFNRQIVVEKYVAEVDKA